MQSFFKKYDKRKIFDEKKFAKWCELHYTIFGSRFFDIIFLGTVVNIIFKVVACSNHSTRYPKAYTIQAELSLLLVRTAMFYNHRLLKITVRTLATSSFHDLRVFRLITLRQKPVLRGQCMLSLSVL